VKPFGNDLETESARRGGRKRGAKQSFYFWPVKIKEENRATFLPPTSCAAVETPDKQ